MPWDEWHREGPTHRDIPPERTSNGDFIFYHGTSKDHANEIIREKRIRPDDMNCVGLGTTPSAVSTYALMKSMKKKMKGGSVILRVIVKSETLANLTVGHECGGSGCNQFLFSTLDRSWIGIPVDSVTMVMG
jgi:hypothetical protein